MNQKEKKALEFMGFRTGEMTLPGLDINITLEPYQYFFFRGPVDNMEENDRYWADILNMSYERVIGKSKEAVGRCIYKPIRNGFAAAVVYHIKEDNKKGEAIMTGHESTHVLFRFGLEHKLLEALEEESFNFNPLTYFYNEEDVAEVGGILSLYKLQKGSMEHFSEFMDLRFAAMAYMEQNPEMIDLLH